MVNELGQEPQRERTNDMARKIRKVVNEITNFLRLMRGVPPTRAGASNAGASNAGARQARESMHVSSGGGGGGGSFGGSSAADKHLGEAIARGHKEQNYGDPASPRRVVG